MDGLTRGSIVRTAIDLLDAEGLDGLSMRKLGTRLGAGATSVYWHVGNRDNLVALAVDHVFGEVELPDPAAVGWREALRTTARSTRVALTRHPWSVSVLSTRSDLNGPSIAAYQAHTLDACLAAGFAGDELDHATDVVFSFVFGSAVAEAGSAARRPSSKTTSRKIDAELIADARRWAEPYPALRERYDVLAGRDPVAVRERTFTYGLDTVLDGLALRAPAAAGNRPGA